MIGKKGENVISQRKTEGGQSNGTREIRELGAVGEDLLKTAAWTPGCFQVLTEREGSAGPRDPEVPPADTAQSSYCWLLSARLRSSTLCGTWILMVH